MKNTIKLLVSGIIAAGFLLVSAHQTASAVPLEVFPSNCSGSRVCANSGTSTVTPILKAVIDTLIWVSGIISVIVIIVGGIMYALAAGDQGKITKAKDTVLYAVIGLVVSILAFTIVNFVLSKV